MIAGLAEPPHGRRFGAHRGDTVADVVRFVGSSAAGTVLVLTYIHRGVIDDTVRFTVADKLVRKLAKHGEPWRFGLVPSETHAFVRRFGLSIAEDLGADEYRRRYLGDGPELEGYAFPSHRRRAHPRD